MLGPAFPGRLATEVVKGTLNCDELPRVGVVEHKEYTERGVGCTRGSRTFWRKDYIARRDLEYVRECLSATGAQAAYIARLCWERSRIDVGAKLAWIQRVWQEHRRCRQRKA